MRRKSYSARSPIWWRRKFAARSPAAAPRLIAPTAQPAAKADVTLPADILGALGGGDNVRSVNALHGRYRVELADAARIDEGALARLTRGIARLQPSVVHILHD
jgi:hypothetical protein